MKLTIIASDLRAALDLAQKPVSPRSILPVLAHVLIEAHTDGGVTLSGTDLKTRAEHTVAAQVDEAGAATIAPRVLSDLLDAVAPDAPVAITANDAHKVTLVAGRITRRTAGLDPEGFPPGSSFDDPAFDATLGADVLARLIAGVAHAAAKDDSRAVLAGIGLTATGGTLTLAAADSYRLAVRSEPIDDLPDLSVIPEARGLAEAARHLAGATSARLLVDARRSALRIDSEAGCWSVALIEGRFPDFWRIIPTDPAVATIVTVDRADLARACRLIRNVRQGKDDLRARLTIGDGELVVWAHDGTEDQEARAVLDATIERGSGLEIAFNGAYLSEAVGAIESERLTLELVGPESPGILREAGDRGAMLQVVMPMHDARKGS